MLINQQSIVPCLESSQQISALWQTNLPSGKSTMYSWFTYQNRLFLAQPGWGYLSLRWVRVASMGLPRHHVPAPRAPLSHWRVRRTGSCSCSTIEGWQKPVLTGEKFLSTTMAQTINQLENLISLCNLCLWSSSVEKVSLVILPLEKQSRCVMLLPQARSSWVYQTSSSGCFSCTLASVYIQLVVETPSPKTRWHVKVASSQYENHSPNTQHQYAQHTACSCVLAHLILASALYCANCLKYMNFGARKHDKTTLILNFESSAWLWINGTYQTCF